MRRFILCASTMVVTVLMTVVPFAYSSGPPACSQTLHDSYTTLGPDGLSYPTWHPTLQPTGAEAGCTFGHEHGANPATSNANSSLPAFGYAAAVDGMTEPHTGFKVFVLNFGDTAESNVANKIADEDVRIVFHMGTGGVGRYVQQHHSIQIDYLDRSGSGRSAHVTGLANTGPASTDGSTCDRHGGKDFSATNCADKYEIWNGVRFQLLHPSDPWTGLDQSRFGAAPSIATFDPITTRDPSDNSSLLYTENLIVYSTHWKQPYWGYVAKDPLTPEAYFQGCRREFYTAPFYWRNSGQTTIYYTDAMGHINPAGADTEHPIRQEISASTGTKTAIYKLRAEFCGNGIHTPN